MRIIGIDLGGTRVKTLTVNEFGNVLYHKILDTGDTSGDEESPTYDWKMALRRDFYTADFGEPAVAVGVAAPGLVAQDSRSIAYMPGRLQGLEGLDWTQFLKRKEMVPVINDAKAALLAEAWVGAAKGLRNVFMLTLGTGVGGAAIVDGRLLQGHIGRAGHLGHICLDFTGPQDVTGIPGALEDAIGECTLRARAKNKWRSTQEVVDAHLAGDAEASQVWLTSIKKLACGIASLINVLDPEAVILGGGIALSKDALFAPLQKELDRIEWRPGGHRVKILPAELGPFAGAIGAARNAMGAQ